MPAILEELRAVVTADTRAFKRGMKEVVQSSQQAGTQSSSFFTSSKLAIAGMAAASYIATRAVFRVGEALATAAGNAEEVQNKYQETFKAYTYATDQWVTAQRKSIGYARSQWQDMLADIQDFLVPMGFARSKAAELSKQLTLLAVDLGSFKNIQPEAGWSAIGS